MSLAPITTPKIPPDLTGDDGRRWLLEALRATSQDYAGLEVDHRLQYHGDVVRMASWLQTEHVVRRGTLTVPASAQTGSIHEAQIPDLPRDTFMLVEVQIVCSPLQAIYSLSPGSDQPAVVAAGFCNVVFRSRAPSLHDYAFNGVTYRHEALGTDPTIEHEVRFSPVLDESNTVRYELVGQQIVRLPRVFPRPVGADGSVANWRAQIEVGIGFAPGTELQYVASLGIHRAGGLPAS